VNGNTMHFWLTSVISDSARISIVYGRFQFDLKAAEDTYGSDSDDVDESLVVPTAPINEEVCPFPQLFEQCLRMHGKG
jgi:hypothetical protein